MPRIKKESRGRGRGNVNRGSYRPSDHYVPASMQIPNDYSMQQEALDTQRHNSTWSTERGLRHRNINFVSAGAFDQSKLTDPSAALAKMTLVDVATEIHANGDLVQEDKSRIQDPVPPGNNELLINMPRDNPDIFVIDTRGNQNLVTKFAPPQMRSPSPTPSASSDEVILFGGRDSTGRGITRSLSGHQIIHDPCDPQIKAIESRVDKQQTPLTTKVEKAKDPRTQEYARYGHSLSLIETSIEQFSRGPFNDAMFQPDDCSLVDGVHTLQREFRTRSRQNAKRDDTQSMIDDYITNLEEQGLDLGTMYSQRDLGGTDSDACQDTDSSSRDASKEIFSKDEGHSEMGTFGGMKPYIDALGIVKTILSKRNTKAGLQYLVAWNGRSMDDTDWVSKAALTDPRSIRLVEQYELNEKWFEDQIGSGIYFDKNATGDEDMEASDDDMDLAQRKIDHKIDEKIARLLVKQKELGIGSAELLVIDDSLGGEINDGILSIRGLPGQGGTGQQNRRELKREFLATVPSAKAYDAYDGFDILDFERPSLKKRPKNHRDDLLFDISDSELEASMQTAWENDRSQKRRRKEERQELRAQGLLGQKRAKPDVRNMYQEGMTLESVKQEIRNFLMGDTTTLALPSMDKADRKIVHEIAYAFNINSKSAGNGNKRFPVLFRTARTSSYSESKFAAIEAKLTRRYFPRMDVGGRGHRWVANRAGRGGFAHAAVSYRDGDIVGGSAPELGLDNKGRAILEKMGWSTGTALGAVNNKGILQPVSHVVKTSKAGLG